MTNDSETWSRIDRICDEFEQAWQNGEAPAVPDWLDRVDAALRVALLPELVRVDLEYRMRTGHTELSLADYVRSLGIGASDISPLPRNDDDTFRPTDDPGLLSTIAESIWNFAHRPKPPPPAPPGQLGNYEIVQPLGEGGMGIVYKARQSSPDRLVALKTLPLLKASDPRALARFEAEIAAVGRLNHPGIVAVYEAGNADGLPYYSMALIDGKPLSARLRDEPMASRATAELALHLADALHYAHQEGIVHRDIKPGNVLIDGSGRPLLSDFGLAKCLEDGEQLTESGLVLGTAAYMPPEQAAGSVGSATPTADIYSLGATMYHCLTGRPPFQASQSVEVLRQVLETEPVPPRLVNPDVDVDLETICLKCLDKNPARRFATAEELGAELQRYLNGEAIQSRRLGFLGRCIRFSVRRPATVATVMLAVALIVMVSAGIPLLILMQSERDAAQLRGDTQRYFSLDNEARQKSTEKQPGWTWEVVDSMQAAARLEVEGKDPVQIRSHIAGALISPDVRLKKTLQLKSEIGALASSSDGRLVALAEIRGSPLCRIHILEIVPQADGAIEVTERFTCDFETGPTSSERPDGFRSVCISPDGSRVAAGTRNGDVLEFALSKDGSAAITCQASVEEEKQGITRVAYSADGKLICFINGDDLRFSELNPESGKLTTQQPKRLHDFLVRPDGTMLVGDDWGLNYFAPRTPGYRAWEVLATDLPSLRIPQLWASNQSSIIAFLIANPEDLVHDSPDPIRNWIADGSSGFPGIPLLHLRPERGYSLAQVGFDKTSSVVAGAIHGSNAAIGIWDALSGTPQCSHPFSQSNKPLMVALGSPISC